MTDPHQGLIKICAHNKDSKYTQTNLTKMKEVGKSTIKVRDHGACGWGDRTFEMDWLCKEDA